MDLSLERKWSKYHTMGLVDSMNIFMNKSSFPSPLQFVEPMEKNCVLWERCMMIQNNSFKNKSGFSWPNLTEENLYNFHPLWHVIGRIFLYFYFFCQSHLPSACVNFHVLVPWTNLCCWCCMCWKFHYCQNMFLKVTHGF